MVVKVLFGIVAYLFAGGFFCFITNGAPDYFRAATVFFWPFTVPLLIWAIIDSKLSNRRARRRRNDKEN